MNNEDKEEITQVENKEETEIKDSTDEKIVDHNKSVEIPQIDESNAKETEEVSENPEDSKEVNEIVTLDDDHRVEPEHEAEHIPNNEEAIHENEKQEEEIAKAEVTELAA